MLTKWKQEPIGVSEMETQPCTIQIPPAFAAVAGPPDARAEIRPWLDKIGKNIFEVGDKPGQAQLMKLVNNLVNAANMATAFEALVLGAKGGLNPDQMVDVLNVSTGQNSATLTKVPKSVLPGTFDYGSSLTIMVKDVMLGLQEAEALVTDRGLDLNLMWAAPCSQPGLEFVPDRDATARLGLWWRRPSVRQVRRSSTVKGNSRNSCCRWRRRSSGLEARSRSLSAMR